MVLLHYCLLPSNLLGNITVLASRSYVLPLKQAARSISSKTMKHREHSEPKPAPFPYKEKRYNFFRALFDPTPSRLDDNSKLVVIEGPPAAGKGVLAKELANELGMAYFPAPTQVLF